MRIRTVKPEFFTHPEIVVLSPTARLLLLSLLTQADDEGRLYDQPRKVAGLAFGDNDDVDVAALLDELAQAGRIERYEATGRRCIQVTNFTKHQVISHARPSVIPPRERSRNATGRLPEPSSQEWNGREGNGTGKGMELPQPLAARKKAKPRRARQRDELFEAIHEACGVDWREITDHGGISTWVNLVRKVGGRPEEAAERARNYRTHFRDAALTPTALCKHWALCAKPARDPPSQSRRLLEMADRMEATDDERTGNSTALGLPVGGVPTPDRDG